MTVRKLKKWKERIGLWNSKRNFKKMSEEENKNWSEEENLKRELGNKLKLKQRQRLKWQIIWVKKKKLEKLESINAQSNNVENRNRKPL